MSDKGLAHLIIADLMRIQQETGALPTRNNYPSLGGKFSKHQINVVFGSWTKMLIVSGLKYSVVGKRDQQELKDQTYAHVKREIEAKKLQTIPPRISSKHLFISDMHEPYGHPDTHEFLFALDDKYKFDRITIGGDEIDGHAWSFHDKDPDLLSPGMELTEAIKKLEPLASRWPSVDILESNHGSLIFRKGKHHGLPRHVLKPYAEVLGSPPGWKWHEELDVQFSNGKRALVHHGYSSNILLASQRKARSLIQFHFHTRYSIQYWSNGEELFFAMQLPCLIDPTSPAYIYNKLQVERPMIGVGAVFNGLPTLLPMLLDSRGRWNRSVP